MSKRKSSAARKREAALTASIGEIMESKKVEEKAEETLSGLQTFLEDSREFAVRAYQSSRSFLSKRPTQIAILGFGAGLTLVGYLLKRREA